MPLRSSSKPVYNNSFAPQPAPAVYRKIAFTFLAVTVVILIGALWLSSVQARITVNVKEENTNVDTFIQVAANPDQGQLHGAVVQGTFQKVQEFSASDSSSSTPSVGIVTGTVKIINNYSQPQTLVKTTRLLTADNRLYRIDKTVTLQPKESILVTAASDQPGAQYILDKGTHLTIPGLWKDLQPWIYAESVSGFTGNADGAPLKVATAQDIQNAYTTLQNAVFEDAKKSLQAQAGVGSDMQVVYDKKVSQKTNIVAGQSSDHFLAEVSMQVTAVYYPQKDVEALVRQGLKDKLPDGRELINFDPSQATFTIDQADTKNGTARLHIIASAQSRLTDMSPQMDKNALLGMSDTDVASKLQAVESVQRVDIRISPSWLHTIPKNPSHVEVIVQ